MDYQFKKVIRVNLPDDFGLDVIWFVITTATLNLYAIEFNDWAI